jgi:hypothetical protein
MLFPFSKLRHVSFLSLNLFLTKKIGEGVRLTRKFPGFLDCLELYLFTKGGWRFGGEAVEGIINTALLGKWCWRMLVERGGL